MLFVNADLTEDLSVEVFYQYEWEKTQIDGCGTYFYGADFTADGCNFVSVGPFPDQIGLAAKRQAENEPDDGGQHVWNVWNILTHKPNCQCVHFLRLKYLSKCIPPQLSQTQSYL